MKVKFEKSITFKVLGRISSIPGDIVLRSDLEDLAAPRQISRALKRLTANEQLEKLGYGVYAKLAYSEISKTTYLREGPLPAMRAALTRLNIRWSLSTAEIEYQTRESTQVPVNPGTRLLDRFRRQLRYKKMELKIE